MEALIDMAVAVAAAAGTAGVTLNASILYSFWFAGLFGWVLWTPLTGITLTMRARSRRVPGTLACGWAAARESIAATVATAASRLPTGGTRWPRSATEPAHRHHDPLGAGPCPVSTPAAHHQQRATPDRDLLNELRSDREPVTYDLPLRMERQVGQCCDGAGWKVGPGVSTDVVCGRPAHGPWACHVRPPWSTGRARTWPPRTGAC